MTFPRLAKPPLIEIPSFARSPDAPVFFSRSLPARSTKCSLLSTVIQLSAPLIASSGTENRFSCASADCPLLRRCTRLILKTACERDDLAFMAVESVCRIEEPKFSAPNRSSMESMVT